MRAVLCLLLILAAVAAAAPGDEEAVRKAIVAFNNLKERPRLLAPNADIAPLAHFGGKEVSQMYFEARSIKILNSDTAFVDATASQYGSIILKRSMPAYFVLRKLEGEWKVEVLRVPHRN